MRWSAVAMANSSSPAPSSLVRDSLCSAGVEHDPAHVDLLETLRDLAHVGDPAVLNDELVEHGQDLDHVVAVQVDPHARRVHREPSARHELLREVALRSDVGDQRLEPVIARRPVVSLQTGLGRDPRRPAHEIPDCEHRSRGGMFRPSSVDPETVAVPQELGCALDRQWLGDHVAIPGEESVPGGGRLDVRDGALRVVAAVRPRRHGRRCVRGERQDLVRVHRQALGPGR